MFLFVFCKFSYFLVSFLKYLAVGEEGFSNDPKVFFYGSTNLLTSKTTHFEYLVIFSPILIHNFFEVYKIHIYFVKIKKSFFCFSAYTAVCPYHLL